MSRFGIYSIPIKRMPLFGILLCILMVVYADADRIEPFLHFQCFTALKGVVGPQNVCVREIFYIDRFTTFHSICFRRRCAR